MHKHSITTRALIATMVVVCLGVLLWVLVRRAHDPVAERGEARRLANSAQDPEAADHAQDDSTEAPQRWENAREPHRDAPATPEPGQATTKGPKPAPSGLSAAPLPKPDFLRSGPRFSGPPEIRQGFEARTRRAATLNRRLEVRLTELRAEAERAEPSRRQTIERDIDILETQLEARRRWESTTEAPQRQ